MKYSKGYYCLIQYCPDLSRLEAANVGVLLFCPDRGFLSARVSKNNRRIQEFFGRHGFDFAQINSVKKGLVSVVQRESTHIHDLADLNKFIALRANQLQITPPRPMKVSNPDVDLDTIFDELVGKEKNKTLERSLKRIVDDEFRAANVESKLRRDLSVEVPVMKNTLKIPFGYQNGRFNLIKPVEFGSPNADSTVVSASKYAIEGQYLFDHSNTELGSQQLVIVAEFAARNTDAPQRVSQLFKDHSVKLFDRRDIPDLVEEIQTTGKDFPKSEEC